MFISCDVTQCDVIDLLQTNISIFYNNILSYKMKISEAYKSVLERCKENRVKKRQLKRKSDESNEEVYSGGAFK